MLQTILQDTPAQDVVIRTSGLVGGSVSVFGLSVDTSALTYWAQILADVGIFIGAVAAMITILYTIYKGRKDNK